MESNVIDYVLEKYPKTFKNKEIIDTKIIDIKYLNKIFNLISQKIVAKIIIKNGFKTSTG